MGKRADRQRARILAAIADKAMTATELAQVLHMSRDHAHEYLRKMKADGLVHVASFICNHKGGRAVPCWKAGTEKDAVYVKTRAGRGDVQAMRGEQIKAVLRGHMLSAVDIGLRLHLHPSYVRRYIRKLRDAKEIRIAGWGKLSAGGFLPLYAVGSAPDVARAPVNPQIRKREYYYRHKERLSNIRTMRNRLRRKPNTWASALGL